MDGVPGTFRCLEVRLSCELLVTHGSLPLGDKRGAGFRPEMANRGFLASILRMMGAIGNLEQSQQTPPGCRVEDRLKGQGRAEAGVEIKEAHQMRTNKSRLFRVC